MLERHGEICGSRMFNSFLGLQFFSRSLTENIAKYHDPQGYLLYRLYLYTLLDYKYNLYYKRQRLFVQIEPREL